MTRREAVQGGLLVLLLAGLAGASLNILWYLFFRFVVRTLVFTGMDVLWLLPGGYLLLELLAGVPLLMLLVCWPRPWAWRLSVFGAWWASLFCVGLLFRELSAWATLILSAGIAFRIAASWGSSLRLLPMRRIVTALLLIPIAGGIGHFVPDLAERWTDSRLAPAPAGAPNVLWIVVDAQRAQNLHLYGYSKTNSPRLDSLAASSTVFEWAIAPAPWTLASHASMFSGIQASRLSARQFRPFTDRVPRIAGLMRDHGYRTGAFSANLLYANPFSGLAPGFTHFEHRRTDMRRLLRSAPIWNTDTGSRLLNASSWHDVVAALRSHQMTRSIFPLDAKYYSAGQIAELFLHWQAREPDRPFFAFLNFFDVHEHHRPGVKPTQVHRLVDPDEAGYDDAAFYCDSVIGAITDTLAARHQLQNTVLIVTGDHGELFNEHGLSFHMNNLYTQVLRVPLLMRWPAGIPEGRRIGEIVSTRDIAATILDLAGLDQGLSGASLAEAWRRPEARREPALSEVEHLTVVDSTSPAAHGAMRSLYDDTWHYIRGGFGESLYRYRDDPNEEHDLAADPANADVLAQMRATLSGIPFGY